jgi:hypothetical protein
VLKKSFLGDERNFKGPLMHFAGSDVGGPRRFTKNGPLTFVSALRSFAAAATAKNQLSRDFRCRSIFDFFNTIGQQQTFSDCGGAVSPTAAPCLDQ